MMQGILVIVVVGIVIWSFLVGIRLLVEYITYVKHSPSGNRQTAENIIKLCNTGIKYKYDRNTDAEDRRGFSVHFYDKGTTYDVGFSSFIEYKKFAKWDMHNNSEVANKAFNDLITRYSSINVNK